MKQNIKTIICLLIVSLTQSVFAQKKTTNSDKEIQQAYQNIKIHMPISKRVELFSHYFLKRRYLLGALGEGKNGNMDKNPLYRTDSFDCQTYVSTVLALVKSNNLTEFKKRIIDIRYSNNQPSFLTRNHFVSADWNTNNRSKGYLVDITKRIFDKQGEPVYALARAEINKASWVKNIIRRKKNNSELGYELKQKINGLKTVKATIPYIPLNSLFFANQEANTFLFNQIPSGAIIEIVRPNWDLTKSIGTRLNVSHIGFAIRKDNQLYFREASQIKKKVVDILLTKYLKKYINSPTIKGINIHIIQ